MDNVRKAYQRAVAIPLNNVEQIWSEYNHWEQQLNKLTVSPSCLSVQSSERGQCNARDVKSETRCRGLQPSFFVASQICQSRLVLLKGKPDTRKDRLRCGCERKKPQVTVDIERPSGFASNDPCLGVLPSLRTFLSLPQNFSAHWTLCLFSAFPPCLSLCLYRLRSLLENEALHT